MFQSLNPLQFYARNPNRAETGDREDVPTLMDSQSNLQHTTKVVNWIIYICILILSAILLLTVGFALYGYLAESGIFSKGEIEETEETTIKKSVEIEVEKVIYNGTESSSVLKNTTAVVKETITQTVEEVHIKKDIPVKGCEGCLSFEELKRKAELSIEDAENYIHDTVAGAILPEKEKIDSNLAVSIENLSNQLANIPELRERIDKLLSLNKTFTVALKDALTSQNEIRALEQKFESKVSGIEGLKKEVVEYIQRTYNLAKTKEDWEKEVGTLQNEIRQKNQEFEIEKEKLKENIREVEKRLRDLLGKAGANSFGSLEDLINSKKHDIENIGGKISDCQTTLPYHKKQIILLREQYKELITRLEDIETQINQLNWVDHILQTIKRFEQIKTKFEELRKHQLEKAYDNLESLLHGLEIKEANLTQMLLSQPNKVGHLLETETKEEKIESDSASTTRITYTSFEQINTVDNAEALQRTIAKEQNLLKVWAYEQFNIFNISTNEIKNVTNTIQNLEASIQGRTADFAKYVNERKEIDTHVRTTRIDLEQLERKARNCQDLVENSEKQAERLRDELRQLQDILARAQILKNDVKQEQENAQAREEAQKKEIQEKRDQINAVNKKIVEAAENKHLTEDHLEALTASINQKIVKGPPTEVVERKFRENQQKVQTAKALYQELSELIENIKRIA